jgi:hypothetical protein
MSRIEFAGLRLCFAVIVSAFALEAGVREHALAQEAIVAAAWPGVDSSQVGQLYDLDFRPLRRSVLAPGQVPHVLTQARARRDRRVGMTNVEVKAHARAWGASGSADFGATYAYVRSVRLSRVEQLPADVSLQDLPSSAAYVVSRVHFGHMYEVHMQGSRGAVQAEVDFLVGAGSVRGISSQVQVVSQSNGLTPRAGQGMRALAAESEQDIVANFEVTAEPQAILIEFEAVTRTSGALRTERGPEGQAQTLGSANSAASPGSASASSVRGSGAPLYRMQVVALRFPPRKPSGSAWDILGGRPDMRVSFLQGGREVGYVDAARDTLDFRFDEARPIREVRFDRANPLVIRFLDLDASAHDFAGEVTLAELQTSPEFAVIAPQTNARVLLRVERVDASPPRAIEPSAETQDSPRPTADATNGSAPRGGIRLEDGEAVSGEGDFDSGQVVRLIRQRLPAIRACYERELRRDATLRGVVLVDFTIGSDGRVSAQSISRNTTGDVAVAECVASVVSRLRWSPGPEGGSVTFSYPFTLWPEP